ncbi:Mushroom body large-type Kenyon cell-specific protein 1 [Frankliniella fusca]|uniref:Mushroom body large-type Kenyon cell-specific protein 1 n=1 Tax=Frankliniella fusca TaxID=407009 RepID=A0AAE1HAQ8_9NEOP|nr:Mushroom body large-type Kenyon cell-specific protein 1 [Frankliniella fusca]
MVYKVWQTTKVPCVQEIRAVEKVESLYKEYRKLFKNTPKNSDLKPDFVKKLDSLFDISKKDAVLQLDINILKAKTPAEKRGWEEEKLFLLDQQGPRLFVIGGVDQEMKKRDREREKTEKRKWERLLQEDARRRKEEERRKATGECGLEQGDSFADDRADDSPVKAKRGRKEVVSPEIAEVLDYAKLSNTQATKLIAAVACSSGVSVNNTNINRSTIHRRRAKLRTASANSVRENFYKEADDVLVLHWDGKIVNALDGKETADRLAILVTGAHTVQLLGAPAVPDGTAVEIKKAVVDHLEQWNLVSKVKAMSFDTTNTNSGCRGGAALLIAAHFGKDWLWLPCRHHVFERVLEAVFHNVLGPSTGPEPTLLKDLQNSWDSLDKSTFCTYKDYAISRNALGSCADDILKFATTEVEVGQPRDDYLELLEVSIIFLGGVPPKGIRFHPPGPIHSARWMAKAIYSIKMSLFRKQLRLTPSIANGLLKVAVFVVRNYIEPWFTAKRSVEAPRRDLDFLKKLIEYEKINKPIAQAAQNRFLNHLWYLSEESLGFAVFDEQLSPEERALLAQNILNKEGDEDPPRKRPLQLKEVPGLSLSDLATLRSKEFFTILGLKCDFLKEPVVEWAEREDYKHAREICVNLKVVNDHAERGVKLMSDYNGTVTKQENSFQDLLVTVHSHRQTVPNVKKDTLCIKYEKKEK